MGKIIQLDTHLSNMIAAGEVVENMASVIKELMENAIDAQASSIQIHLRNYGLTSIQIIDDGEGMDASDLTMAFKRHATSKIKTSHDLYRIASLGFRGEALPSIASVAKITIESSPNAEHGHRLIIQNGSVTHQDIGPPRKGTAIKVEQLFYNTPARLKHLKSEQKELSFIVDYVNKTALAHPHIRFQLTHDQKTLFQTSGDGNILKILHEIYPLEIIKNMISFEAKNQYFDISGFLCKPAYTRSTRQQIALYVNHRIIKNNALLHAVVSGYSTYLPKHKYPIVYMNINVDPLFIDVNIHPQKLEVKLTEQKNLEQLIIETIDTHLSKENLIPQIKKEYEPAKHPRSFNFDEASDKIVEESKQTSYLETSEHPPSSVLESTQKLPYLEYIGQYEGTYLLFQSEQGLYLIDQHAAAERIRYEQYYHAMQTDTKHVQPLMIPLTIPLSNQEMIALKDAKSIIENIGLTIDLSDSQQLIIHEIPNWFLKGDEADYAERMVRHVLHKDQISVGELIDQLAKDLACKHSIKANHYITTHEVQALLKALKQTKNPFTCPHGRPTIIQFQRTEIEKMFKRIV